MKNSNKSLSWYYFNRTISLVKIFNVIALFLIAFFFSKEVLLHRTEHLNELTLFFILFLTNLIIVSTKKKLAITFSAYFIIFFLAGLELYNFIFNPLEGKTLIWYTLFPPVSILLLKHKRGGILSFLLIIITLAIYELFPNLLSYHYDLQNILRVVFIYLAITAVVFFYELRTSKLQKQLAKKLLLLKKNKEKLKLIIQSQGEGLVIVDDKYKIKFVNKAALEILNCPVCPTNMRLPDVINLQTKEKILKLFDNFKQEKQLQKFNKQVTFKTFDNKEKTLEITVNKYFGSNKRNFYIIVFHDITRLVQIKRKLKELNTQLQTLIDSIPAYIYYKNTDFQFILANKHLKKAYKPFTDNIIGKTNAQILGEKFYNAVKFSEQLDRQVLSTKKPVLNQEFYIKNSDGSIQWFSTSEVPYFNEYGQIIGIIGITYDITKQKLQEQKLVEINLTLKQYYIAFENSPIGIAFIDQNGIIKSINPALVKITMLPPQDLIDKRCELVPDFEQILQKTLELGYYAFEKQFTYNNTNKILRIRLNLIPNDGQEDQWLTLIVEDITKEKKQIDLINKQYRDLAEAYNKINESLHYAKIIQKTLLTPDKKLLHHVFPNSFVYFEPKSYVSGDFYFCKRIKDKCILAVGDCAGHGIPGALLSMLSYTLVLQTINETSILKPAMILENLRSQFKEMFSKADFTFDLALCIFDIQNQKLHYAGANIPLFIVSGNAIKTYSPTRSPIGNYIFEQQYKEHEINLSSNDSIYITTDGFIDQLGGSYKNPMKYSRGNFLKLISSINNHPVEKQEEMIKNELKKWKKTNQQTDDITVIGIKWDFNVLIHTTENISENRKMLSHKISKK